MALLLGSVAGVVGCRDVSRVGLFASPKIAVPRARECRLQTVCQGRPGSLPRANRRIDTPRARCCAPAGAGRASPVHGNRHARRRPPQLPKAQARRRPRGLSGQGAGATPHWRPEGREGLPAAGPAPSVGDILPLEFAPSRPPALPALLYTNRRRPSIAPCPHSTTLPLSALWQLSAQSFAPAPSAPSTSTTASPQPYPAASYTMVSRQTTFCQNTLPQSITDCPSCSGDRQRLRLQHHQRKQSNCASTAILDTRADISPAPEIPGSAPARQGHRRIRLDRCRRRHSLKIQGEHYPSVPTTICNMRMQRNATVDTRVISPPRILARLHNGTRLWLAIVDAGFGAFRDPPLTSYRVSAVCPDRAICRERCQ